MRFRIVIACVALLLTGCAVAPSGAQGGLAEWTRRQGGEVVDARLDRLRQVGDSLTTQAGCASLHFHLLNSQSVSAYSWPTGDLYVTAGLLSRATDNELTAAIAHELGHLLGDGHMQSAVSLRGLDATPDVEQRADAIGCRILLATGHSPSDLVSVLEKVCDTTHSECRGEIRQRITLIRQHFPD